MKKTVDENGNSSCTDSSTSFFSVATRVGGLLTCPSTCWTTWVTARDIVVDRACTSTVIRFCGGVVVTDSAVSLVKSEALCLWISINWWV